MNLAVSVTGRRLSDLLAGFAPVPRDVTVTGVNMSSGRVVAGDLFLALSGQRVHGLDFLGDVVAAGAAAVAWEPAREGRPVPAMSPPEAAIPAVRVDGLYRHASPIAARFFGHPSASLPVVGVTGTNGKTSIAQLIAGAVHGGSRRCGVIGTLGHGLYGELEPGTHTTPDAVTTQRLFAALVAAGAEVAVMEVSSHALEQGRVEGVAFDVAVFSNLSHEHLDFHGDMHSYGASKERLFHWDGLSTAVINVDDPFGAGLLDRLDDGVRGIGYSLTRAEAAVHCRSLEFDLEGIRITAQTPWGEVTLRSPLLGRFNAANLLAATGALGALGLDAGTIGARLGAIPPVAGRMERFGGAAAPLVVVDYAHTPAALEEALSCLRPHCSGALWVVFGCGGNRDRDKRAPMGRIAETLADRIVITDDNPRTESPERIIEDILAGVTDRAAVSTVRDRGAAITSTVNAAEPDDVVLVAGKGHEEYQDTAAGRAAFSDRVTVEQALARRRGAGE